MDITSPRAVRITRRQFGKVALAALPTTGVLCAPSRSWALGAAAINSKINGVRIGAISYSFRAIPNAKRRRTTPRC